MGRGCETDGHMKCIPKEVHQERKRSRAALMGSKTTVYRGKKVNGELLVSHCFLLHKSLGTASTVCLSQTRGSIFAT